MKTLYNKILKAVAPLLCVAVLTGCSDDYLKPDPLSMFEPEKTFNTEAGLRAAMTICDKHLRRNFISENSNSFGMVSDLLFTDIAVYGKTDAGGGFFDDIAGNLTPTSWVADKFNDGMMLGWMWNDMWDHVKYANTVITNIDKVQGLSEDLKNEYLGRAYFHRAWGYYNLSFWFGNLPIVSKLPVVPKQDYRSTPIAEVMKWLCHDLKEAVEYVPSQSAMTYYGMVNKEACRHLYVKCLIAAGDYVEAEKQATILIEQSGLSLMKEPFGTNVASGEPQTWKVTRNVIWDLHRPENKILAANREYILGVPNISEESFEGHPSMRVLGPFYVGNIITPDNTGNGIDRIARTSGDYDATRDWIRAAGRGIGVVRPTDFAQRTLWVGRDGKEDLQDLRHNPEVGNWLRMEDMTYTNKSSKYAGKNLMLYAPEDIKNGRGQVTLKKGTILCTDTIRSWFDVPLYKIWYLDKKNDDVLSSNDFQGSSLGANGSIYIYRLAETYLLRAEARLYQGKAGLAAEDVNEVRRRANAKDMYTTVNIGDIMNERARELYMEEYRKAELTRVSMCLAMSGTPDEWGNVYDINTWDKQSGTDLQNGSYWYQRLMHYSFYGMGNQGIPVKSGGHEFKYRMDKKNLFWPIPKGVTDGNIKGQLWQNYGYEGYDPNCPLWDNWEDAYQDAIQ